MRLAKLRENKKAPPTEAVKPRGGVVTIGFACGEKPMSDIGGVGKVLGPSRTQIPEYQPQRG